MDEQVIATLRPIMQAYVDQEVLKAKDDLRVHVDSELAKAKTEIESQMRWYVTIFGVIVAAAASLTMFAGFLGYKKSVDEAVLRVQSSLSEETKKRIVADTAKDLEPRVKQKMDDVLANADRRFLRQNLDYEIENVIGGKPNHYYLDVLGSQPHEGQTVDVSFGANQRWRFVEIK